MSEILVNKAKSVAITGHRVMEKGYDIKRIEETFNNLIDYGFNTFYIGMALGFDTVCFQILEKIRENKDITLIACVPCPTQAYKFNENQKREYDRMLSSADQTVLVSKEYTNTCMQKRNMYMVDRAGVVVAYLRIMKGGTKKTVDYARKNDVPIIYI